MKELIYKDDAIAICKRFASAKCRVPYLEQAFDAIPSVEPNKGEWIPCSERLPSNFNEDETVLATTDVDGPRVVLMLVTDVERFYLKGYVTAWMPSPKPWKGVDDEAN